MPHTVTVERDDAVAVVTLQRPEARNALDLALKEDLLAALEEVGADTTVRAVVLTGAGPAFCVGQDLREHVASLESGAWATQRTVERHYGPLAEALTTMPKPVIAAVRGACVGAGLGIALACDLRVLADDAVLGTAFGGVGLTFDTGLSATLTWAVGAARARELVLLGETFDAESAVGWGIGGRVVPAADVLPTARELARRLAAGPTLAHAASKRLVAAATTRPLTETLAAEAAEQDALGRSADHREAVDAFLARRSPTFTAR
ncbi:enoyl-CoA hydratase [Isoptericola sp. CG 20/1183]|uniref:Enoyl-CoA hydratase n=1 Tax=Isoptericola halotolerans TaxID=300560 RepID=A0ABX5EBX3_9MICO|nr:MULTISPECIES: enoyl-CoA hydratase-related protein [Isoptericola]MCK0117499.1 enoyl-CoA hydratase-related protein [Isoptericola sp. S6320L]PRZ05080.1 enoyl-CoA hydratase [Isoptericola halotolerans]PRZ05818.1 enoyl-CoA hydratase [Isoptericola sp. CG 20/1183]